VLVEFLEAVEVKGRRATCITVQLVMLEINNPHALSEGLESSIEPINFKHFSRKQLTTYPINHPQI
jgi:hypothetical protein